MKIFAKLGPSAGQSDDRGAGRRAQIRRLARCAYRPGWENSTLLAGDAGETVRALKQDHDKTLVMFGSGKLLRVLMRHGLVDELVLMVHPLVLGEGSRLCEAGQPPSTLTLSGQVATATVWRS